MLNCRRKALDKIVSTDRQTDRLTDGWTAMAIPVYPLHFVVGGITILNTCRM